MFGNDTLVLELSDLGNVGVGATVMYARASLTIAIAHVDQPFTVTLPKR